MELRPLHLQNSTSQLQTDIQNNSSQYLQLAIEQHALTLTFRVSETLTLGSAYRAKELRRRIKAKLDKWSPVTRVSSADSLSAAWGVDDILRFHNAVSEIERTIGAFQKDRLEPKIVREILGIGAQEYRRWIKDGRLPKSGTGQFKKGKQIFQFYTHAHSDIAALVQRPETIQSWRVADQADGR